MINFFRRLIITGCTLISPLSLSDDNPHLYGCYFSQARESGQWITTTKALLIEKADDGILLHGNASSLKNSWISGIDNTSPVFLKRLSANKYRYRSPLNVQKSSGRCELVLHHDKTKIYINKYAGGCSKEWHTGDGIGPSQMSFDSKQANADMCLSYLGVTPKASDNVTKKHSSSD